MATNSSDGVRDSVMALLDDALSGIPAEGQTHTPAESQQVAEAQPVVADKPVDKPVETQRSVAPQPPAPAPQPNILPDDVMRMMNPNAPAPVVGDMEDPPDPPDVKPGTKAAYAWQALKAEKKKLATELAQARAEVQAAKATPAVAPEEVTTLKTQLAEYEQKLGQYDLSSTTEFRNRFDVPVQQGMRKGAALLQRAGKTPEQAQAIMQKLGNPNLSLEQVQDLVADEPIAIQGALVNLSSDLGEIYSQREDALKSWKETRAALQIQEQRNREVRLAEDIELGTRTALGQVIAEGNFMMQPSQDQNWNAQVQQRLDAVKGIVRSGSREEILKWVMEGITAKPLRELLANVHQVAEQRRVELDQLVQKGPRLGSSDGRPAPAPRNGPPRQVNEIVDEIFSSLGPQQQMR